MKTFFWKTLNIEIFKIVNIESLKYCVSQILNIEHFELWKLNLIHAQGMGSQDIVAQFDILYEKPLIPDILDDDLGIEAV